MSGATLQFPIASLLLAFSSLAFGFPPTSLSPAENQEIEHRLEWFYRQPPDPAVMNYAIPNYDVAHNQWSETNAALRGDPPAGADPLIRQAGLKATSAFQQAYCRAVLAKKFPKLKCAASLKQGRASREANDRVEDLVASYIPEEELVFSLDQIPTAGKTIVPLWSDDYWKTRLGGTSFRYATYDPKKPFKSYAEAVTAYSQPREWRELFKHPIDLAEKAVVPWSPAEKYDLAVGDERFSLTREQKGEGQHVLKEGDVESWIGICHGWSAASIMAPRPTRPATLIGRYGLRVQWNASDIKAMASLAWANAPTDINFIGGRCDMKDVKTYPNGRIQQQECFDTNPATFHLALGNLLGKKHHSFVMDRAFDYQVWNQPVSEYELTYFNPLDPKKRSRNWREVAVDYDASFRKVDRFQHPLTRGIRSPGGYDDTKIKKIVGVIASVTFLLEVMPIATPEVQPDAIGRTTWIYDLELQLSQGELVPRGGEWNQNSHADFLWVPKRNSIAAENADYEMASRRLGFTGEHSPGRPLAGLAREASAKGVPLCRVVKELFRRSSGQDEYVCPEDVD